MVQGGFGIGALLLVRWGFRSWPAGSYTWIPILVTIAGLGLLVVLGRALSMRGLPFGLIVASWYVGRLAGALASGLVPGIGLEAALIDAASFGTLSSGRAPITLDTASLIAAVLPIAVLAAASIWGTRIRAKRADAVA
jgi:hypothetical protein